MYLSQELSKKCRVILLKCSQFDNFTALQSVFITKELFSYRDYLPQDTNNKADLVNQTISFLVPKDLSDGQSVFVLFLEQLCNLYDQGNSLREELTKLSTLKNVHRTGHCKPRRPDFVNSLTEEITEFL